MFATAGLTAGPLIALVSVLAGSLGVPVPTAAALVFAGSLLARSHGNPGLAADTLAATLAATLAGGMAGALAGDVAWFFIGRRYGTRALALLCRLSLSRDTCVRRTIDFFAARGVRTLLFTRFVPGLSMLATPMAGASAVSFARFIAYAATGDALWIGTFLLIGYYLTDEIGLLLDILRRAGLDIGGVAIAVAAAYVAFRLFRRWQLVRQLRMARISPVDLMALIAAASPVILDVRSAAQRDNDPFVIPGAVLLDFNDRKAGRGLPQDRPVIVYCACPHEMSAALLAKRLHRLGIANARPLLGGLDGWREAGGPVRPLPETVQIPPSPEPALALPPEPSAAIM